MTPLQKIKEFEAAFPIYLTAIVVGVVYLFLMEILHLQQFRGVVAALGLLVLWVVFDLSRRSRGRRSLIRFVWKNQWLPIVFWLLLLSSLSLFGILHQFGSEWLGEPGGLLSLVGLFFFWVVLLVFYSAQHSLGVC